MMGGTPGKIDLIWDPLGFTKNLPADVLARKRLAELKNGCAPRSPPPPLRTACETPARAPRSRSLRSRVDCHVAQPPRDDRHDVAGLRALLPQLRSAAPVEVPSATIGGHIARHHRERPCASAAELFSYHDIFLAPLSTSLPNPRLIHAVRSCHDHRRAHG